MYYELLNYPVAARYGMFALYITYVARPEPYSEVFNTACFYWNMAIDGGIVVC